ncbi:DoxX family protein [Eisenibacter elegans]|jgi:uncharacterized membrane protein|uniref:DoxX family protein n=1 Tax=Eisenibacter elegans TaxID=997 RepID=UPI000416482A|nr:MauE/DoxX family redox-associated membrane protein [Eisenibacter elegans]
MSFLATPFSLYLTVVLYLVAGINHFINPRFYERMMPSFLPAPVLLHKLAGVVEIVLAVALLIPAWRLWAVWGLVALLVSFFLVHIPHLIRPPIKKVPYWIYLVRVPIQFFLIYWAWSLQYVS